MNLKSRNKFRGTSITAEPIISIGATATAATYMSSTARPKTNTDIWRLKVLVKHGLHPFNVKGPLTTPEGIIKEHHLGTLVKFLHLLQNVILKRLTIICIPDVIKYIHLPSF
jgi:hypothetical protein